MSGTVFLVNPASANGATGKRWAELERQAQAGGLEGESRLSTAPGEIAALAEDAARSGAGLVVAVGGDGTVHEAVNGLLRAASETELAVLPRGTSEDFARALGIPHDWDDAVSVASQGSARLIDAGWVRYTAPGGTPADAYFASMAGVGMSGAVARRLNTTTKALGGKVSGLIATLAVFSRWRNVEMTLEVDGERRHGLTEDVLVANTRFHNGGMKLCPDANPDDGVFDVLVIGDASKVDLVLNLPKLYRGTHLSHPKVELLRGARVTVDAAEALPIELDGEQPGTTPVEFEVLRSVLRVRVPALSA